MQEPANDWAAAPDPRYPGERLGLAESGRGSLASWGSRVVALVLDWAISMALAVAIFTPAVVSGHDWRRFMILVVFFLESAVLSAMTGSSFGQLITRIAVFRLDAKPLGFPRAVIRAALVSLVVPALLIAGNRRGIQDLALGTVVINRR